MVTIHEAIQILETELKNSKGDISQAYKNTIIKTCSEENWTAIANALLNHIKNRG